jgi:hypothetical protein
MQPATNAVSGLEPLTGRRPGWHRSGGRQVRDRVLGGAGGPERLGGGCRSGLLPGWQFVDQLQLPVRPMRHLSTAGAAFPRATICMTSSTA